MSRTPEQIDREMAEDLDSRRVVALAKLGQMLSKMAGEGLEIEGFDTIGIFDEVLMALNIEDQDSPDHWLDELTSDPDYSLLADRLTKAPHP